MRTAKIKIGELARRTGVSVRSLHHYDELGLLPSQRTLAGHRCYEHDDVVRLLRIRALQSLGFSLEKIRACLDDESYSPGRVLELQLEMLDGQVERVQRLRHRVVGLLERIRTHGDLPVEEFLKTIEEMSMFENYYTPEQLEKLAARKQELGEERLRAVQSEWPQLIAQMRAEMSAGTPADDPKVQELAQRWNSLIEEFTGGDAGTRESLGKLYRGEAQLAQQNGLDAALGDYVRRASKSSE